MQSPSKRQAFRDPRLEEEFSRNGYVVIDLTDPDELQRLLVTFHQLYPYDQEGCVFSCRDSHLERRMHAQTLIRNVIEVKALALLNGYQFVSGSFVAKHPGERGRVQPHTDLTFVDPQHYSAIAVWTPLTEITPDSGPLHVLPGSHQYTPISGSNLFKSYEYISISEMVTVKPRIGQAVCYDVQLIHASPANKSVKSRIATNSVFTPIGAQLLHLTQREGRIYRYAVDLHFYAARGGDEIANQDLLMRYPVLDSQPVAFDQDYPSSHGRKIGNL